MPSLKKPKKRTVLSLAGLALLIAAVFAPDSYRQTLSTIGGAVLEEANGTTSPDSEQ